MLVGAVTDSGMRREGSPSALAIGYTVTVWVILPGALFVWANRRDSRRFRARLLRPRIEPVEAVVEGVPVEVPEASAKKGAIHTAETVPVAPRSSR